MKLASIVQSVFIFLYSAQVVNLAVLLLNVLLHIKIHQLLSFHNALEDFLAEKTC